MVRFIVIAALLGLSACAGDSAFQAIVMEPVMLSMMDCKEPRPQTCIMIYDPVCGATKNGLRKTYASDCSACADENVTEFEKGVCP